MHPRTVSIRPAPTQQVSLFAEFAEGVGDEQADGAGHRDAQRTTLPG